jgi:hypothetical protein
MKRILLSIGIVLTACNLSLGIAYAAVCESTSGARACGQTCAAAADGNCACFGSCTADELKWVEKKGGGDEEMLIE